MEYNKEYTIWVTYHIDSQVFEYDLVEDEHHKLFPTHKSPKEGKHINFLNPVWSEIVTMWYVWKNNLKSEYVGFEHYRRHLMISKIPKEGHCQVYAIDDIKGMTIYDHYARYHNKEDLDIILGILEKKFGKNNYYTYYLKNNFSMIANCTFFMKWENFVSLCNFIFPIVDEYSKQVGIPRKIKESLIKWEEKANNNFNRDIVYQTRVVSFLVERLISSWIEKNMIYYL